MDARCFLTTMNASELFLASGKSAGVWYCTECKLVRRTQEEAEACCAPYECNMCGCELPRKMFRTRCSECIEKTRVAKMQALMDKASLIENGMHMYHEHVFCDTGDKYGDSETVTERITDYLSELEPEDRPKEIVIWICGTEPVVNTHAGWILDQIELPDECEDYEFHGVEALDEAMRLFNEANSGIYLYKDLWKEYYVINVEELMKEIDAEYEADHADETVHNT